MHAFGDPNWRSPMSGAKAAASADDAPDLEATQLFARATIHPTVYSAATAKSQASSIAVN